ncbi:hypothetical protein [Spiroplasma endosymbiont of Aspidapion aeneum]|uniref:hypothetical protein n=1 Tax=Spiroplasma endosymbiont of Aspidapion aeneum TaxID=3066276 RepID=UPI00313B9054
MINKKIPHFNNDTISKNGAIVCIGFFDLVHKSHEKIFTETINLAKKNNKKSICFTFDLKPIDYIKKEYNNCWDGEFKVAFIKKEFDFDEVVLFKCSPDFIKTTAVQFIDILKKRYNVEGVVCGSDFKFGYENQGKVSDLVENFKYVLIVDRINELSTTSIKKLLFEGKIDTVNKSLEKNIAFPLLLENNKLKIKTNFLLRNGFYLVSFNDDDDEKIEINLVDNYIITEKISNKNIIYLHKKY